MKNLKSVFLRTISAVAVLTLATPILIAQGTLPSPTFVATWNNFGKLFLRTDSAWQDIRWYGAKVDGVTDDTAAFTAARNTICTSGGKIFVPAGVTIWDGATTGTCSGIHIVGAGRSASFIQAKTATGNPIKFGNGSTAVFDLSLENVTVAGFLTGGTTLPTSGNLVEVSLVNGFTMRDFTLVNWSTGLLLDGGSVGIKVSDGYVVNGTPTTGRGIDINNALGAIHHINITGAPGAPNQPFAGIVIRNSAGFWLDTIDQIQSGYGLAIVPAGTDPVKYIWVSNSDFDTNTNGGLVISGSAGSFVGSLNFASTHFSSNGVLGQATGVSGALISSLGTVNGVTFTQNEALNNSGDGFTFNTGTNITIDGGSKSYGNNWATNAFYSGVQIGAGASHVAVRNSRIGLPVGEFTNPPNPQQLRGILTLSGSDYLDISHNDLVGNGSAILNQSVGTHNIIKDNLGYNPVGVTGSTTVGTSPATICAAASSETHYLRQSATNTATVSIGGTVVGTMTSANTPIVTELGPNECEVVTWATTAPTYTKSVH